MGEQSVGDDGEVGASFGDDGWSVEHPKTKHPTNSKHALRRRYRVPIISLDEGVYFIF
jgi:hypothetical protein